MTLPLLWIDAFTTIPYEGNPCAVVLDAEPLDERAMQTIAREMNLSETAFVRRSNEADFAVRFFTPAEEIPLAGHPTIAVVKALLETGRIRHGGGTTEIRLELRDGPISVRIEAEGAGAGKGAVEITMRQRKPRFQQVYNRAVALPAFGLAATDVDGGLPIQTVSTGTPQLMIPVRDHAALRRAAVDLPRYVALRESGDFFSPHLFCLQGATLEGRTFARHFGVPPDTQEDPFTGSATGGMAAYLWHHCVLEEPSFVAEQGHWMGRPGRARVEVLGPRDDIEAVLVSGTAVMVLRGEIDVDGAGRSPVT